MEVLMGMFGALLGAVMFGLGWYARDKVASQATKDVKEASEAEQKKLREQQAAFQSLMNYNADMAYGLGGGDELK